MSGYNLGDIYTRIKIDTSEFKKSAAGLKKSFADIGKSGLGFAAAQVGLDSIRSAINFVKNDVIKAASDFEETTNVINVGFGEQAASVEMWAKSTASAMGRSQQQMRGFAGEMQQVLPSLLGSSDAAAELSTRFSELAVDMGSFFNVADADALRALKAGLIGEAEPMKRFGVILNEATVRAKALELGLISGKEKLTEYQKTAARAAVILERTSKAHGDAERTSYGYANSVKGMKAAIEDAVTVIGIKMLPTLAAFARGIRNSILVVSDFAKFADLNIQYSVGVISSYVSQQVLLIRKYLAQGKMYFFSFFHEIGKYIGGSFNSAIDESASEVIKLEKELAEAGKTGEAALSSIRKELEAGQASASAGDILSDFKFSEWLDKYKDTLSQAGDETDKFKDKAIKDFADLGDSIRSSLEDAEFEEFTRGMSEFAKQEAAINEAYRKTVDEIERIGEAAGASQSAIDDLVDAANREAELKIKILTDNSFDEVLRSNKEGIARSFAEGESAEKKGPSSTQRGQKIGGRIASGLGISPGGTAGAFRAVGGAVGKSFEVIGKILKFAGEQLKRFGTYIFNSVIALEPFQVLFSELNEVVQETLYSAFKPLMFALKPIVVLLANAFANLSPLFSAIANALAGLGPIIENFLKDVLPPVVSAFNSLIPIIQILTPVFEFLVKIMLDALVPVIEFLAKVINLLAKGIVAVYNFFASIIPKMEKITFEEIEFDDIAVTIDRFNEGLNDGIDAIKRHKKALLEGAEKVEIAPGQYAYVGGQRVDDSEPGERLREVLRERAEAAAKEALDAVEKRKELEQQTLDILSGGNENLPAGFKLALEKFKAIDVDDFIPGVGPQDPLVAAGDSLQLAASMLMNASLGIQNPNQLNPALAQASGSGRGLSIQTMQVVANNPRQLMRELDTVSQIRNSTNTGNPYSTDILGRGRF